MGRCPKVSGWQASHFGFPHIKRHQRMTKIPASLEIAIQESDVSQSISLIPSH